MLKRHDSLLHLNKVLFKKKKWIYKPRGEEIRLNNEIFKRRSWLKRQDIRFIDIQKLPYYFLNFKPFEAFYFFNNKKIKRLVKSRIRNTEINLQHLIAYRVDHIIFLANWAYSLEHARALILRGVFLVNNSCPNSYTTLIKKGDVITVSEIFKNYITRLLNFERLHRTRNVFILNKYRTYIYRKWRREKNYKDLNDLKYHKRFNFSCSYNVRQKFDSYTKWRLIKENDGSFNVPNWKRNEIRFYLTERYSGYLSNKLTTKIWKNYNFNEKTFNELKNLARFKRKKIKLFIQKSKTLLYKFTKKNYIFEFLNFKKLWKI